MSSGGFDLLAGLPPTPDGGVYLDNNATTAVAPEVIEAMLPYLTEHFGNPSSMHRYGAAAGEGLATAREQVAALLGVRTPSEIIFTAGGSESDNLAIVGTLRAYKDKKHVVTSAVEHPAVIGLCRDLEARQGYEVDYVKVDAQGRLDFDELRAHLKSFYSHTGRPSIDPELMIRMLVIGYCYGIRSERRLCEEVQLNLAYRWFCRLSIEDKVPDHSTLSKTRHGRFRDSEALRFVFEQVVERCISEGLVGGEGFAVDASVVKADANRQRARERDDDDDWPKPGATTRAVREYLEALDEGTKPVRRISLTDPAAQWTAAPGGPAFFAYSTNYLVDTDAGVIVDVEATRANLKDEVASAKVMVERVDTIKQTLKKIEDKQDEILKEIRRK